MRAFKVFCTYMIVSCFVIGRDSAVLPSGCIYKSHEELENIRMALQYYTGGCFTKDASIFTETFNSRKNCTIKVAYADVSVIDDTITKRNQRKLNGSAILVYPVAPLSISDTIRGYCHRNITEQLCTSLLINHLLFDRIYKIANHYKYNKVNGKNCKPFFEDIPSTIKGLSNTLTLNKTDIINLCSQTLSCPRFNLLVQDHDSERLESYAAYLLMKELTHTQNQSGKW